MIFRILTVQVCPKSLFKVSHKVDLLIEKKVTSSLKGFDPGFDLDFSISCNENNKNDLILADKIKHRGERKSITQQLILPNCNLYYEPDFKFYTNRFDFKLMERGYKTYPLDKYIQYTITGIELFFLQNEIEIPLKLDQLKNVLVTHINTHKNNFAYENEEKRTLREIINREYWAFHLEEGKNWLNSEIGQKWLMLASKYTISQNGMLELKNNYNSK